MWRRIIRRGRRADGPGGQHEFAFLQRQHLAPHDAGRLHPAGHADGEDDQQEGPQLRPEDARQRVAEQHDHDQQQRQQRQRQEQVGQPHQRPVQAAEIARQHADQRAEQDRDGHRDQAHGQRHLARPPSSAPACRGPAGRCPAGCARLGGWLRDLIIFAASGSMHVGSTRQMSGPISTNRISSSQDDQPEHRALVGAELLPDGAPLAARAWRCGAGVSHSGSSGQGCRRGCRRSG